MFLWFYIQEHPKPRPAVVLVWNGVKAWGHSLKSHPTDPGIKLQNYLEFRWYLQKFDIMFNY